MHPTGSLKHRLARSLFLYGLCNGWIVEGTTIVEASSGSTAVSEAYFARFLGLPFIAVMPASTSPEKIALIESQGGVVPPGRRPDDGRTPRRGGWRASATATSSTSSPSPSAPPTGAATTTSPSRSSARWRSSATPSPRGSWSARGRAGRARRSAATPASAGIPTQMCVVDPEDSIFYAAWAGEPAAFTGRPSRIEGIGRQRARALVPAGRRRPDDPGARRRVDRDDAARARAHRAQHRRLDRDERLGGVRARRRDAGAGRAGQRRHPDLRRRRPLRGHVLQRRVGGRSGPRSGAVHAGARGVPRVRRVPAGPGARPR